MQRTIAALTIAAVGFPICASADFQYTEKTSITGGMMSGAMRFASAFDRKAAAPQVTTHSVKGNCMRTDNPDGTSEVIDLSGRRIISIDSNKKTYSVMTFDQMKANLEKMQQQMQQKPQNPQTKEAAPNVTVKPSFQVTEGTGTQMILGQQAHEVKTLMNMTMQSQAPADAQPQQGSAAQPGAPATITTTTNVDSWIAPSVPGYEEIGQFYAKMAKEMADAVNWTPTGGMHANPAISQSMAELQKNSAAMKGLPLVTYMSISTGGLAQGASAPAQGQGQGSSGAQPSSASSPQDAATLAAMNKLAGMFGRRKKQEDAAPQGPPAPPPPPSNPNALMETTTQVVSFSSASLDGSLFDVPAGYTQVQPPSQAQPPTQTMPSR